MANKQFCEKIILLNKEKVCLSTNAKSHQILRKTVIFNILLFWVYKKVILQAINITFYGNCHSIIAKLPDVSLLVKHMINDSIFNKNLGYIGMWNNIAKSKFLNLFYTRNTYLLNGIILSRYVKSTQDNLDNFT